MSKKYIISISRRTDVLAFPNYIDWFLDKLERGGCYVRNPIVKTPFYVSLLPEDVYGFVFWTKDPGPVIPRLDEIDAFGKPVLFFLTITVCVNRNIGNRFDAGDGKEPYGKVWL